MRTKNYIKIIRHNLLYAEFMFLDTEEYLADQIFINNGLPVHFYKEEFVNPNCDYRFIRCRIRKKYKDVFYKCMEELVNKMLLTGHSDYVDFCNTLIAFLEENR